MVYVWIGCKTEPLKLKERCRLKVSEKRMLRRPKAE
jgi:hypothetical protein